MVQRVDDGQAEPGQRDDDDEQHGDGRRQARDRPDLVPRDLRQRPAVAAHRGDENHEVLHRARQHRADNQPEKAGEKAELRGQHGAKQRARARNRGEMVAEEDPPVGGLEIRAVVETVRGRQAAIVQFEHALRKEAAVKPVRQDIEAGRGHHQPQPVDLLAGIEDAGDDAEPDRAERRDRSPPDGSETSHTGGRTQGSGGDRLRFCIARAHRPNAIQTISRRRRTTANATPAASV